MWEEIRRIHEMSRETRMSFHQPTNNRYVHVMRYDNRPNYSHNNKFTKLNEQEYLKIIKSNEQEYLEIMKNDIVCSICMCGFDNDDIGNDNNFNDIDNDVDTDNVVDNNNCYDNDIYQISCKHYFHKKCINSWLDRKKNCPLCRTNCLQYCNQKKKFVKERELYHDVSIQNEQIPIYTLEEFQLMEYLLNKDIIYSDVQNSKYGKIDNIKFHLNNHKLIAYINGDLTSPIMELNLKDISLVIYQTSCSPETAIKALICNDFDLVNAIMDLCL